MDARLLTLLRELSARGTVSATAAALHVTPSAVSQQLRVAERSVGLALVEPDGRGVRLTAAGRLLAEAAVDVLGALARAERALEEFRGALTGTVDIATLPSAGVVLVPRLLEILTDEAPGLRLILTDHDAPSARYAELTSDHDVVIGQRMSRAPLAAWHGLRHLDLLLEPLDVALRADHPLAEREHLTARDLAELDWVGVPADFPFDAVRRAVEQRTGVTIEPVQRVTDNSLVEALVWAGAGVGLLPRYSTRPRPGVALRRVAGLDSGRLISALARPDVAERAGVAKVLDVLARVGAEVADEG